MKLLTAITASLFLLAAAPVFAAQTASPTITITHSGARASAAGSAQYFTGSASVETLAQPQVPSRLGAAVVTFEPGAGTAWHTHPLGQLLIVTDGTGWVQQWGGPKRVIKKGDVVWIPPGVKHWHGATSTTPMTHIAVLESLDGKNVDWMEHVSDVQYDGGNGR